MAEKVIALTLLALLAGCPSPPIGGTFCDNARPMRPTDATIAVMTDAEVEDALAHNLKGQRLCGWTP